jgi:hypothetical protein
MDTNQLNVYLSRISLGVGLISVVVSFFFGIWGAVSPEDKGVIGSIVFNLIAIIAFTYIAFTTKFLQNSPGGAVEVYVINDEDDIANKKEYDI